MSRVSVRMVAMLLTVLAGAAACRAGSGASAAVPADPAKLRFGLRDQSPRLPALPKQL